MSEFIRARFVEVCQHDGMPAFRAIESEPEAHEFRFTFEVEQKFRSLVDSNSQMKQVVVFWENTSTLIACEATRDSHRPRELIWLHRGIVEHSVLRNE